MNRRSFLSFLGGAAVVAADPEALLWKPGTFISIPRTLYIPRWNHISSSFSFKRGDYPSLKNEAEDLANLFIPGAAYTVMDSLSRLRQDRLTFGKLELPYNVDYARLGGLRGLPDSTRVIVTYDAIKDRCVGSVECLVKA